MDSIIKEVIIIKGTHEQEEGAHNINLVTPSHYTEQIRISLELAKKKGLHIPIVYNTGGYDSVESLRTLEGLIFICLI